MSIGEIIVKLENGNTIRSASSTHAAGDYVRVCNKLGEELVYWDHAEWAESPVEVMGAILISANLGGDGRDDK